MAHGLLASGTGTLGGNEGHHEEHLRAVGRRFGFGILGRVLRSTRYIAV